MMKQMKWRDFTVLNWISNKWYAGQSGFGGMAIHEYDQWKTFNTH
ncbi:hypothetical protein [Bacillus sp. es.034]|nr:hypothetical protein [Bacillus sp. es.034]